MNAPRDVMPLSQAVENLRIADVLDSVQLQLLIDVLDIIVAAGDHRLMPRDLPRLLDEWVDDHLDTQVGQGCYDAAHLRYQARLFASSLQGFPEALAVICERVWVWRRTMGQHCPRTLPAQWVGVL